MFMTVWQEYLRRMSSKRTIRRPWNSGLNFAPKSSCCSWARVCSKILPVPSLIRSRVESWQETISPSGQIAYFEGGGGGAEGTVDCRQWLTAIQKGTEPLVKPEQALVVTRILDHIYRAAEQKKEIRFES